MLHTAIQTETSQQRADRLLAEHQASRGTYGWTVAVSSDLHETGAAFLCDQCDGHRLTEVAYCPDCGEVTGSYVWKGAAA